MKRELTIYDLMVNDYVCTKDGIKQIKSIDGFENVVKTTDGCTYSESEIQAILLNKDVLENNFGLQLTSINGGYKATVYDVADNDIDLYISTSCDCVGVAEHDDNDNVIDSYVGAAAYTVHELQHLFRLLYIVRK